MSDHNRPLTAVEREKYQVWHQSSDGFTPVALVSVGNLLGALVFTMSRTDGHWENGDHVLALRPDARSTTFGDVIVNPEGVAYEVRATAHGVVFDPIDFPPYREQQALFAEWTQDYALARERLVAELFGPTIGAEALLPEPSRPANDNLKDRDDGIER
jgi:hypothetical protein